MQGILLHWPLHLKSMNRQMAPQHGRDNWDTCDQTFQTRIVFIDIIWQVIDWVRLKSTQGATQCKFQTRTRKICSWRSQRRPRRSSFAPQIQPFGWWAPVRRPSKWQPSVQILSCSKCTRICYLSCQLTANIKRLVSRKYPLPLRAKWSDRKISFRRLSSTHQNSVGISYRV